MKLGRRLHYLVTKRDHFLIKIKKILNPYLLPNIPAFMLHIPLAYPEELPQSWQLLGVTKVHLFGLLVP